MWLVSPDSVPDRPVSLGLFGCGARTGAILQQAAPYKLVTVDACYDVNPGAAEAMRNAYGGAVVPDVEALMNHPGVEAFLVSLYPGAHAEALLKLLEAGKPIYIEKPVATNLIDAHRVLEACREVDFPIHVGIMHRYVEVFRRVKQMVHGGRIGRMISVHSNWVSRMHDPSFYPKGLQNWRFQPETGGELIQHYCHQFDWFRQLGGELDTVTAQINKVVRPEGPIEDTVNVILQYVDGALASGHYSLHNPRNTIMGWVEGTEGAVEFEWGEPSRIAIYEYQQKPHHEPVEVKEMPAGFDEATRDGMVDFVKAVRGKIDVRVTIDDAIKSVQVGLLARRSHDEGRRVAMSEG